MHWNISENASYSYEFLKKYLYGANDKCYFLTGMCEILGCGVKNKEKLVYIKHMNDQLFSLRGLKEANIIYGIWGGSHKICL